MSPKNREYDNRNHQSREDQTIGGHYSMDFENPFRLPPEACKDGYKTVWVNTDPKFSRLNSLGDQGADLIPSSRAPKRFKNPLSNRTREEEVYYNKDTVALEMPEEIVNRREHYFNQKASQQVSSLGNILPESDSSF